VIAAIVAAAIAAALAAWLFWHWRQRRQQEKPA
jgi:membrane protein implicated in regulation of membrane protease activity